jgi:hypothetical protein
MRLGMVRRLIQITFTTAFKRYSIKKQLPVTDTKSNLQIPLQNDYDAHHRRHKRQLHFGGTFI